MGKAEASIKAELAKRANEASRASRSSGAPTLVPASPREAVCAWLQWCDPNGSHVDRLAIAEGCEPYDEDGAWRALASMLAEDE